MRGLLDHLTDPRDPEMIRLRRAYVFKVVPSLNPDGVICGKWVELSLPLSPSLSYFDKLLSSFPVLPSFSHRCSMAAKDLNRQWLNPSPSLHPTIFHTKCLINLLAEAGSAPYVGSFTDFVDAVLFGRTWVEVLCTYRPDLCRFAWSLSNEGHFRLWL